MLDCRQPPISNMYRRVAYRLSNLSPVGVVGGKGKLYYSVVPSTPLVTDKDACTDFILDHSCMRLGYHGKASAGGCLLQSVPVIIIIGLMCYKTNMFQA